ncbi:MAG: ferrochelatase [Myxococcota bacterium]|nr:ferrochelatase [Myxococcota bacterium]
MSDQHSPTGALLINLGTPDAPTTPAVRRFLAEFLSDPRVLTMPGALRFLLLHGIILRTRPRRSAAAYAEIWQPEGSPLMIHGRALHAGVETALGDALPVELAMRYGQPNVDQALQRLSDRGVRRLIVLPLFPQYSEAVTGSILAHVESRARRLATAFERVEIRHFPENSAFIQTAARLARPVLDEIEAEHLLMSFHGLPESQVKQVGGCLESSNCCETPGPRLETCYRAQCFVTSRALHAALGLQEGESSVSFQSRLGRQPWIQPYTDQVIKALRDRGIRRLAVICPAFVADNIETLEEIGLRLREDWHSLGGEAFGLVPCPNAEPDWIEGVAQMVTNAATA